MAHEAMNDASGTGATNDDAADDPLAPDGADGFVCRDCGFFGESRGEFDSSGLAMMCPDCGSTWVEHYFPGDATDEVDR